MKKLFFPLFLFISFNSFSQVQEIAVIPEPVSIVKDNGTFTLPESIVIGIDKNPATPQKFGVRGIPTLIIFKDGKAVSTKVGSLPKSKLIEWIDSVVA